MMKIGMSVPSVLLSKEYRVGKFLERHGCRWDRYRGAGSPSTQSPASCSGASGVRGLRLFGSIARGDALRGSGVDVMVEFESRPLDLFNHYIGLWRAAMPRQCGSISAGREIWPTGTGLFRPSLMP